uniref:10 kDa zein n=1 Tax=Zea mays TaxID=4577 RepID=Q41749_MAIZE|nr:10 kDa zein [Zea mays]
MAAKMLALYALLALCGSGTSATHIPAHLPPAMPLGTMNRCMQYCMMQQGLASLMACPSLMLQQLLALPPQTSPVTIPKMMKPNMMYPLMMPSMMSPMGLPSMMSQMMMPQCLCDAASQIMLQQQLPFMFNQMAMTIPPMFLQQPFVGAEF